MNDLQKFIVKKGLEKASLDVIKQTISNETHLSKDEKEFWLTVLEVSSLRWHSTALLLILLRPVQRKPDGSTRISRR